MKIIAILGDKGGAGKTLVSHAVCHGLAIAGADAYHCTTDQRRRVLPADGRIYAPIDCRDPAVLGRTIDYLGEREGFAILDGGGNRPQVDAILAKAADIVLIPFQASAEDLRVARTDLDRMTTAVGVPNRWPSNTWQRTVADRNLDRYLAGFTSRLLQPILEMNALSTLLDEGPPSPKIGSTCKQVAIKVLERLGINLLDIKAA
jgi:chromosome partitioning protein